MHTPSRVLVLLVALMILCVSGAALAQLSGTKYIGPGGDYTSFTAAINDLNTQGVGGGGVTFNVTVGQVFTENPPAITATGTFGNPIIFQKNGAGTNPKIVPATGGTIPPSTTLGALGDAIIRIMGGDYITFDAIDLQDYGDTTGSQEFEYGYLLARADSLNACQNVTIKNCSITLNKTTIYSAAIYLADIDTLGVRPPVTTAGRAERIKFFANTISDVYVGILLRGNVGTSLNNYSEYDHFVEVGVGNPNTITNFGGGGSTAYAIYAIYQDSLKIASNVINGGAGTTTTLYGIFTSTGTNSSVDIYHNTVTIQGGGTSTSIYAINNGMGGSGTDNTVKIYNNTVENCTYPTGTTGAMYLIYQSTSPFNVSMYGNIVRNNTRTGTSGTMYAVYNFNTATGGNEYMYNNQVYGNTCPTTGAFYCVYSNPASTTNKVIYGNLVYNNSGGGSVYPLTTTTGNQTEVYRNRIYDIATTSTGTGKAYGIYVTSGTQVTVYNNFISDLRAPDATSTTTGGAVIGLYVSSSAASGSQIGFYYNTVYLNATGSSANFTTSGMYTYTSPNIDAKNNVIINASTPGATGRAVAHWRSGTSLTTYTGNNNCFKTGTPSATNLIYYDGTNSDQTLAAYKSRLNPQEAAAFTEDPPFVNIAATPYDLHMQTTIATQTESGGIPVTSPVNITMDYDTQTRNTSSPDVGADEFAGIPQDLTPPAIVYTPLSDGTTSNRTLTATVTDASGVAQGTNKPRLYYRKHSDGSYAVDSNPAKVGDDYTWTINYANVGGGSVAPGDTIKYYVAAQDSVGTPNVGTNPSGGSGANPPGTTPPPTPNFYIIRPTLSGTFTVGVGGNFTTITAAADTLDGVVLGGAVTFSLIDATYPSETFPIVIPPVAGASATNTVTFRPAAGVSPTISGSSSNAIFRLNGADFVTIDGSNAGGSSRDMTIVNSNNATSTAVIWLSSLGVGQGAANNTLKNLNLAAGVDQSASTSTTFGIIACGTTISSTSTTGYDNDNNTYTNNAITKVRYGILSRGVTGNPGSGTTINRNVVGPTEFGSDEIGKAGIVVMHEDGFLITQNTVRFVGGWYGQTSGGTDRTGIGLGNDSWSTTSTLVSNGTVTRNRVHDIVDQRTYSAVGIALLGTTGSENTTVANNVITGMVSAGTAGDQGVGIGIAGGSGDRVVFNSISLYGWIDSTSTSATSQSSAGIRVSSTGVTNLTMKDNAIRVNVTSTTTTLKHYAIVAPSSSFAWGTGGADYNDYYVDTTNTQMVLGGIGTSVPYTDVTTLASWKTQFTPNQDAASIAANPLYNSLIDPQPQSGSPLLNAGTTISGITEDFLGVTRTPPPSIGAYENSGDASAPSIAYTPLTNTSSTSNRTLSGVAITDPSGVNTSAGTKPRVYYRKTTNANTYVGNTSATNGWKYVETSSGSSPFSFTINYALLYPSGTVSPGDEIQYFVVAQDLATTPNVGINAGNFNAQPTSVALTAGAFPISGSINSYLISVAYSGSYNVGTGQTFTTLTGAGGFFGAINNGVVSGNITVNIVSDITEPGTEPLNQWAEQGGGGYTMLIQPATAPRKLSGSASGALIRLAGADRVTIDGRIGGSGNNLTVENTSSAASTAALWVSSLGTGAGATGNTVRNCIIRAGADQSGGTTTTIGILSSGTSVSITSDGADNDNNTYRENIVLKARYGIYLRGTSANPNTGTTVANNTVGPAAFGEDEIGKGGIIAENQDTISITGNTVRSVGGTYAFTTSGTDRVGVGLGDDSWTATSSVIRNAVVTGNIISNVIDERTYAAVGIVVAASGTGTKNLVANNVIYDVRANGTASDQGVGIGIAAGDSDRVVFNSIRLEGDIDPSPASSASQSMAGIRVSSATAVTNLTLKDNAIYADLTSNTTTINHYAIVAPSAAFAWGTGGANNNDYYVNAANTQMALGGLGTTVPYTPVTSLAAWQGTFTPPQDGASIAADPLYNSATNLRPQLGSPLLAAGAPITGVTLDALGVTRNATTPSIGAYEQGGEFAPPAIVYTALGNTSSTSNRQITAAITDPSGIAGGGNGPRLYYKKSTDGAYVFDATPTVGGDNYTFTFNYALVGGGSVTGGDVIQYYIAAQDVPGNAGTNPTGGSGSNPPGTTPPSVPNSYKIVGPPLAGDYTVGLTAFNEATGLNLTVGTMTRQTLREVVVTEKPERDDPRSARKESVKGMQAGDPLAEYAVPEEQEADREATIRTQLVEVEETVPVLLHNGRPYDGERSAPLPRTEGGPEAVYPTITAAIADVMDRGVTLATRFLLVDPSYAGETWPIVIGPIAGAGPTSTVTLKPQVGVSPVIGANVSSMIELDGASYFIIDGSNTPGGTTRNMTLRDSSTTGVVITLKGDAANTVVKNCVLEGGYDSSPGGVVKITTATGDGNSGNTIMNNAIRNRSDATADGPYAGIYCLGSSGAPNSNNTITDNDIFNWGSYGIYVSSTGNGDGWTISRNSFYDNTGTVNTTTRYGIYFTVGITSGGNTFEDNVIGGTAPNAGGAAWQVGGTFYGIYVSCDTAAASTISGNTVQNINQTGTGSYAFYGIYLPTGRATISGNTVGHPSAANSIQNAGTSTTRGIQVGSTSTTQPVVIENNVIANIRASGTGTSVRIAGIWYTMTATTPPVIRNNTIHDLATAGSATGIGAGSQTAYGIYSYPGSGGFFTQQQITGNTVYAISAENTGDLSTIAVGIAATNFYGEITGNLVYDIRNLSTGTTVTAPPIAAGIYVRATADTGYVGNNMVSLGEGQATNTQFNGFWQGYRSGILRLYHNSVRVAGTATAGTHPCFGFLRGDNSGTAITTEIVMRNNILSVIRTGGSAGYHSIGNQSTTANDTGWSAAASNYNVLHNVTASTVGLWGSAAQTFAGWQTASGGDANSAPGDPLFLGPPDLHITNLSSPASNTGTFVPWVNRDFDNGYRDAVTPDIGADEFGTITTVNVAVPLATGWNMVSNPVIAANNAVQAIFPSSVWNYVFGPTPNYPFAYNLINGEGYWEKNTGTLTQNVLGGAIYSDTLHVPGFWIMVGSISFPVDTASIVSSVPGLRTSLWYGFNNGYFVATTLDPGKGYWVKTLQPGWFYLAASGPAAKPTVPAENAFAELNALTITDREGATQTLYFGPEGRLSLPVEFCEMPPPPPAGVLDARFIENERGFMVRVHDAVLSGTAEFPIAINATSYPLTVSWTTFGTDAGAKYLLTDGAGGAAFGTRELTGDGSLVVSRPVGRLVLKATGGEELPKEFALMQNYPNPFNPSTTIKFALPVAGRVTLDVFNIVGQRVRTLVDGEYEAGYHALPWDGRSDAGQQLASGVYFYRLHVEGDAAARYQSIRKMLLLK